MIDEVVSIILPIYNTPIKDIQRCINSIINQDYDKIELIIIDDGSNNDIADICDRYTTNTPINLKTKVIHQSNAGVSAARNRGIKEAQGEYLMFVDADDELLPNIIADAVTTIRDNNLDILYGTVIDRSTHGDQIRQLGFSSNETLRIYSNEAQISILREYFLAYETPNESIAPKGLNTASYNRLFRSTVIGAVQYDTTLSILEDTIFNAEVISNAKRVGLEDKPWDIYYKNEQSAVHTLSIDNNADIHCNSVLKYAYDESYLNACYMNICAYLFLH